MLLNKGFTLLELIITLVIVSILATIALPSYNHFVIKTRRSEGKIALLHLASQLEFFYHENSNSYRSATLTKLRIDELTEHGFYKLAIAQTTNNSYLIKAIPQKAQAKDLSCQELTLDQLGQQGQTGKGSARECWG